jgi:hypothetical protein
MSILYNIVYVDYLKINGRMVLMNNFINKTMDNKFVNRWWLNETGIDLDEVSMTKKMIMKTPIDLLLERKLRALDFISDYGENALNHAMAILERKKLMTDKACEITKMSVKKIREGGECAVSDLVLVLLLITRYRSFITDEMNDCIKKSILSFRYCETVNDTALYFDENYKLLLYVGQYLAGYLYPSDIFEVCRIKGSKQYETGKQRLEEWFSTFDYYGYEEWNSVTNISDCLVGFFMLYLMAPDDNIYKSAKKALDFTFKITDYNTFAGIMSTSYGNIYEEILCARQLLEPNFLSWISYGKGYMTNSSKAAFLYCLSDYIPTFYQEEVMLRFREWMSVELDQGTNRVKTYFYKTKDYLISSVRRFQPFVHGHQQHLMNVAMGSKGVQYYINHPKELPSASGNSPGYWAGNGTIPYIEQYKNVIIMIYRIDTEEIVHYIHAYTPFYEYDEYEMTDHWLFIRVDDSYAGTYFSNGIIKMFNGLHKNKEIISEGLNHGLVIKCGSKEEYRNFDHFKNTLKIMDIEYDGYEKISFHDFQYGMIEVKNIQNVTVDGLPIGYKYKKVMDVRKGMLP